MENREDASVLRKRIMRRVYAIWFAKRMLSPQAVKAYIFSGLLAQVLGAISVRSVVANSPSFFDIPRTTEFFGNAFINTELTVQASSLAVLAVAAWIAHDIFRQKEYS